MTEKFKINPFDRSALTDFRQLAGRADEFRQIRFVLRNSAKNKNRIKSILLTGERGVGKTSILNLIESECESNNIIPIRIDLTEANSSNSTDFFWHLFSQTINKLFALGFFDGKGGSIDATIQNILNSERILDQANWVFKTPILRKNYLINKNQNFEFHLFIEDLRLMRKEVNESKDEKFNGYTKILFLVDESQNIYTNKKIIEEVRFVLQSQDLGVGFVFAGNTTYKTSTWEEVFGGSHRDFEIINLSYFDDVDSVIEFFKKSLGSINWTTEEIEETLFYRFKLACRNIFKLTSGKPAWINTVASKMFERCMSGEVKQLQFDKQAQNNVKRMLEESGELDKSKLNFIENLSVTYELWLAEIFACELRTFRQVYFYSKFIIPAENFLDLKEYEIFCKDLVLRQIISVIEEDETHTIGFKSVNERLDFLDTHYYAFNFQSDTTKQWLQIRSNGKFSFGSISPATRFASFINDELVTEKINSVAITQLTVSPNDTLFRISKKVEQINAGTFNVNDETYEIISMIFKACKRLKDSREKQVLYIEIKNELSGKIFTWNLYNYNDKDKIIPFRESPSTINRFKTLVQKFNTETDKFKLEIIIDKILDVNLEILESAIINSGDAKMVGIILEDKMDDLRNFYIKESKIEESYEIAKFFYKLFEEGHDLRLDDLNNTAYVFTEKNELDKAILLLNEAKRKISVHSVAREDLNVVGLVLYNLAIVETKNKNYKLALKQFEDLLIFYENNDVQNETASVLKFLELINGEIQISEIKEGSKKTSGIIDCKKYVLKNVQTLKNFIEEKNSSP